MPTIFFDQYAKWIIITLTSLFLVLIIGTYLVFFFSLKPVPMLMQTIPEQKQKEDLDINATSVLFGLYIPDNINEGQVRKSQLEVTVVGILLAKHVEESQVIIRSLAGKEKIYTVGDEVPGGAVIKRIMADSIVVERKGILERLSFPKNDLTFEPVAKPLEEE